MDELRFTCTVHRHTTTLTVHGSVEADRCEKLRDAIAMASIIRSRGPIVVDVTDVDRLSPGAVAVLRSAAANIVSGRQLTVRTGSDPSARAAAVPSRRSGLLAE